MTPEIQTRILHAVDQRFDEQCDFLAELSSFASTRGNEQQAQGFIDRELRQRGYQTDLWEIDVDLISGLPGFSPIIDNYEQALNLVATHRGRSRDGKSLILNGHVDVVPVGPLDMWHRPPFEAAIEDGWMYGRGTGDMKAGLACSLYALDALRTAGYVPAADVFYQSVVEEECTGNGALACLQRGYRADAALIPEPFNEQLLSAQIGVIWMQVHLRGVPVHVLEAGSGASAIEAALPLITALRELEKNWNSQQRKHPLYEHLDHPLNLNIGRIEGGDWTSSVPAWCCFDIRMAIYPGQDIQSACSELEACLLQAASEDSFLRKNPPRFVYHGFLAEGYALAEHKKADAHLAIDTLKQAHQTASGKPLQSCATTATTDARFFGLYADTPALVYGPQARAIHGFNECVNLESMRRVTQATALFIAHWCGLDQ